MLNESNGELKCCDSLVSLQVMIMIVMMMLMMMIMMMMKCCGCDSLVSLQEALTKEMDAKFEKITKQKKLNTSLPTLPQLSESLTESLENR